MNCSKILISLSLSCVGVKKFLKIVKFQIAIFDIKVIGTIQNDRQTRDVESEQNQLSLTPLFIKCLTPTSGITLYLIKIPNILPHIFLIGRKVIIK